MEVSNLLSRLFVSPEAHQMKWYPLVHPKCVFGWKIWICSHGIKTHQQGWTQIDTWAVLLLQMDLGTMAGSITSGLTTAWRMYFIFWDQKSHRPSKQEGGRSTHDNTELLFFFFFNVYIPHFAQAAAPWRSQHLNKEHIGFKSAARDYRDNLFDVV